MSIWQVLKDDVEATILEVGVDFTTWYFSRGTPAIPASASRASAITTLVQHYNSGITFTNGVYSVPSKGVTIHALATSEALVIAQLLAQLTPSGGMTTAFIMACLCIESLFDPGCENGNLAGSNPTNQAGGYDVGIAQMKLKYINEPGVTDATSARAFALDPAKAIPAFIATMTAQLRYANIAIAAFGDGSAILPQFRNPYYYATGAYNFGSTGMKTIVASATVPPAHCETVKKYEQGFASALGSASVFADISG